MLATFCHALLEGKGSVDTFYVRPRSRCPHYRQPHTVRLVDELTIRDTELVGWLDITRRIMVVFHSDGVLTQFEGYEQLLEFDWEGYREKYGNIQRLDRLLEAEGDSTNRYKLAKQADVLMLLFLLSREELQELLANLGYEVSAAQLTATVAYHLAHTSHGSTLSGSVSAWVLARYEPEQAWQFLLGALESDIGDVQGGTTAEGIHLGAMAGTVNIVLRCLTGMQARGEVLRFEPTFPPEVKELEFSVHYRGAPHRRRNGRGLQGSRIALRWRAAHPGPRPGQNHRPQAGCAAQVLAAAPDLTLSPSFVRPGYPGTPMAWRRHEYTAILGQNDGRRAIGYRNGLGRKPRAAAASFWAERRARCAGRTGFVEFAQRAVIGIMSDHVCRPFAVPITERPAGAVGGPEHPGR
ncbi:MAG: hypothetical protein H7270_08645 [Dermatophilaceae bacterium]|nr:hypothetical protein [Dermatophilaceae bacterium]